MTRLNDSYLVREWMYLVPFQPSDEAVAAGDVVPEAKTKGALTTFAARMSVRQGVGLCPPPCTPNPSSRFAVCFACGVPCLLSCVVSGGLSVAIYHFSVQSIGGGRSAVAAAAYRSGERMEDRNTGEVHDYKRRGGILREDGDVLLPQGAPRWASDRQELWNRAQEAERNKDGTMRKNARVAREWEVALPHELTREQRTELGREFGQRVADRYGVAVQLDFHAPGGKGDNRNWHIHVQATSRELGPDGFGPKATYDRADRDLKAQGLPNGKAQLNELRKSWGDLANRALERAGHDVRIDHRSLADQRAEARERGDQDKARELDRDPTKHMGPAVTAMERGKPLYRNGQEVPDRWQRPPKQTEVGDANRRIELAAELGKVQREKESVGRSIVDTETSLSAALKERSDSRDISTSGKDKKPEPPDRSRSQEQAGARNSADQRSSLSERFGHLVKGQPQSEAEKRLEPPQRDRESPQIITDPNAPMQPRQSLADRFSHLVKRDAQPGFSATERTGSTKEREMQKDSPSEPRPRMEKAQQTQQQESPKPMQEGRQQTDQQEQQNRLQQLAARMEQQRLERERQKREQERDGPGISM